MTYTVQQFAQEYAESVVAYHAAIEQEETQEEMTRLFELMNAAHNRLHSAAIRQVKQGYQ